MRLCKRLEGGVLPSHRAIKSFSLFFASTNCDLKKSLIKKRQVNTRTDSTIVASACGQVQTRLWRATALVLVQDNELGGIPSGIVAPAESSYEPLQKRFFCNFWQVF